MSSRIARLLIGMAVAVAIVPLGIGAVGSAAAHPSGLRLAAQDCLTNRSDFAGLRDRRALRRTARAPRSSSRDRAVGAYVLSRKFDPRALPPAA